MFRSPWPAIFGFVSLVFPIYSFILWLAISIPAKDFHEAKELYVSYFPELLNDPYTLTYLSLALSALAVVLGTFSHKASARWSILAKVDMLLGSVLFCLNLWTLM